MITVRFDYDEPSRRWEAWVSGASSDEEARQAFSAVVLTCMGLDPGLLGSSLVEGTEYGHRITPAV